MLFENRLHLRTQAIETATHVGHAGGDPYLRSGAEFDHLRKLSRIDLSSPSVFMQNRPTGLNWPENADNADETEINKAAYFLGFAN